MTTRPQTTALQSTAKFIALSATIASFLGLTACSMSEEMRRIDRVRQQEEQQESSRSTNLTGEQIFMRSCNTCHPGGQEGIGPALSKVNEHFPDDAKLQALIRKGKGRMPAQPVDALNDAELANLIVYLRHLDQ